MNTDLSATQSLNASLLFLVAAVQTLSSLLGECIRRMTESLLKFSKVEVSDPDTGLLHKYGTNQRNGSVFVFDCYLSPVRKQLNESGQRIDKGFRWGLG